MQITNFGALLCILKLELEVAVMTQTTLTIFDNPFLTAKHTL
jgi:hypothetical protein